MLERFTLTFDQPHLRGQRVHLRGAHAGDWAVWARLRAESRDHLQPWEPVWPADALTRTAFRRRLRRHAREARDATGYALLIFRVADDVLLGGLTLSNIRRGAAQVGTLGYWLGRDYAGRGYMRDALGTALNWCFRDLALHRVEAACLTSNARSIRLLEGAGFQREGLARSYLNIAGAWRDHLLFAKVAGDPPGRV